MDKIEHLYKCYDVLSEAGNKISDHVAEYKDILKAVKGSTKEKRLAAQFICSFFKFFPELIESALGAQLDLCEDSDTQIRRQAIKNLPKLCQGVDDPNITKVAETLAQMLVAEDAAELLQINNSLQTVIKLSPKKALTGIFQQINNGDDAKRECSLKFIVSKLFALVPTIVTKDLEEFIIEEVKKIMQDVSADEFNLCITILSSTKLGNTSTGHAELVNLAIEQSELSTHPDDAAIDEEFLERLINCATEAMPYFSNVIRSTAFVEFACKKVFPKWATFEAAEQQKHLQLRLLKVYAELCTYCDVLENAAACLSNMYTVLIGYMPLPQLTDGNGEENGTTTPSFEFSHAECLLYALHTLGKKQSAELSFLNNVDTFKDFRTRLQFLACSTQGYIKKLEEAIKSNKAAEEIKTEEQKLRATALKTTQNINILIRDLFHVPPIFKHDVQLSFVKLKTNKLTGKRHAPAQNKLENGINEEKKSRISNDRKIYSPPSGKYSAKVQNYGNNNRVRARNGAGGGGGGSNFRNRRSYKKY